MFDKSKATSGRYVKNTDGTLGYSDTLSASDFIKVRANVTYYQSNVNNYYSCLYDEDKNFIKQINSKAFTPTKNGYMRTSFLATNIDIVQVEQGSTETDYVSHSEQNISFPLAQGQKLMEGDYLADDGVHHVGKEKELLAEDVGGNYRADISTEYYCAYFNINNLDSSKNAMCNYFKRAYGSTYNQTDNSFYSFSNNYVYVSVARSIIGATAESTAAECQQLFKDWLTSKKQNGNPIIVNYPLLTEAIDPYTEEQKTAWQEWKKARTYKNVTHISSSDETPANVEIEYVRDLETVINNLSN